MTLNRRSFRVLALKDIELQPLSGSISENGNGTRTPQPPLPWSTLNFLIVELTIEVKIEAYGRRWTEMPKMSGRLEADTGDDARQGRTAGKSHPDGAGLRDLRSHQAAEEPSHIG